MTGNIEPRFGGMSVNPAQVPRHLAQPSDQPGHPADRPGQRSRHQNRDGTAARPSPRQAGELDPEWAMVGVDVPAGKRLYASRDLKGSAFQLAIDQHGNGDGWYLTTTMQKMLVITKPTYGECLAELITIWANWDAEGRALPAGGGGREYPGVTAR